MIQSAEIRLAPAVSAMNAFIEPHRQWIESVLGCVASDSLTFEIDLPFGHFAAEETLKGVPLDRQCLFGTDEVRPLAVRWETAPGISPRIELIHSREAGSLVSRRSAPIANTDGADGALLQQGPLQATSRLADLRIA